eukprot:scaffold184665_cov19-Tisochrysis_lutea.AAC.1
MRGAEVKRQDCKGGHKRLTARACQRIEYGRFAQLEHAAKYPLTERHSRRQSRGAGAICSRKHCSSEGRSESTPLPVHLRLISKEAEAEQRHWCHMRTEALQQLGTLRERSGTSLPAQPRI